MTRSSVPPCRRRRPSRLAALLPSLVVLAVLGTTGGGLTAAESGTVGPVIDLTVTSSSAPVSR